MNVWHVWLPAFSNLALHAKIPWRVGMEVYRAFTSMEMSKAPSVIGGSMDNLNMRSGVSLMYDSTVVEMGFK